MGGCWPRLTRLPEAQQMQNEGSEDPAPKNLSEGRGAKGRGKGRPDAYLTNAELFERREERRRWMMGCQRTG